MKWQDLETGDWCLVVVAELVEASGMAELVSNIHDSR